MVKTGKIVKYDWIWEGFVKLVQRLHKTKTYPYELVLMLPYEDFKKMCESFKKKSEIKEFNTTILTYMDHFKRDMYLDKRDYLLKSIKKSSNVVSLEEPDEKRPRIDQVMPVMPGMTGMPGMPGMPVIDGSIPPLPLVLHDQGVPDQK